MTKTIWITGAASGIGRQTAAVLAAEGHRLILLDSDQDGLKTLGQNLPKAACFVVDLRDSQAIADGVVAITSETPGVDVLINNAGVAFLDDNPEAQLEMLDVNLLAPWLLTALVLSHMRWGGQVINIASTTARYPLAFQGVYSASKAGVLAFSQALREELVDAGIRVSCLLPGPTESKILKNFPEEFIQEHQIQDEPRLQPEDIAQAIQFLVNQPPHARVDELQITPQRWGWT